VNALCAILACLTFSVSMYTDVGHTYSGYWTRPGIAAFWHDSEDEAWEWGRQELLVGVIR